MGHMIQCFIGHPAVIEELLLPLKPIDIVVADLPQDLRCLFLCDKLLNAIHQYQHMDDIGEVDPFAFFTQEVKSYLEDIKPDEAFIYIETDYFGGEGTQSSGYFVNGKLIEAYEQDNETIDVTLPYPDRLFTSPINSALRRLGVIREAGCDEFDTLGLAEYRHMPDDEL